MAINLLPPQIYNRIAAGEVVERPASVVKELVENSLDAGASQIKVEIEEGGIKKICVSDDGCGIEKEDLSLAFMPHATSKIAQLDDLDTIGTLGFRGEALASIASVSMIKLSTKTKNAESGYQIEANGGEISKITEVARLNGTTLTMQNLFYNTPARAKFLKKPKSEEAEVTHLIEKFMLSHPEVSFEYVVDGKAVYEHKAGELDEVIYLIYGREVYDNLLKLSYEEDGIVVSGYCASPKLSRPNRTYQTLFVNGRYVENYMVSACVQGAYEPMLMKGRFPIYVIKLELPLDRVDVNVHPNKKEVKFDNSSRVFSVIRRAVERALISTNLIADFEFTNKEEEEWNKFSIKNESNPQATGFNSFQKSSYDKLSPTEGASYIATVDVTDTDEKIVSPADYQKKGIEIINMPEFSNIKSDERRKNKPGGNIFFDQSGDSLLREVEISVQKEMKEEQKLEKTVQTENFLSADIKEQVKILGVVFKTYIITEFEDSLYVVDQHAMHERQLYDNLKKQVEENCVIKQDLLIPYSVKLIARDKEIFESKLENLRKIGFEIVQKEDEFNVVSLPMILSGLKFDKFMQDVLADEAVNETKVSQFIDEKLCQTACKHAIRAGDSVNKDEIAYLLEEMKKGVALCPHGRPIVVKITKKELEKMFKRVL